MANLELSRCIIHIPSEHPDIPFEHTHVEALLPLALSYTTRALYGTSLRDASLNHDKRITARTESPTTLDAQGILADGICAGQSSSAFVYEDVIFEAKVGVELDTQILKGATNGVLRVTKYAKACPSPVLVLFEYKPSAGVAMDLLSGSDAGDMVDERTEKDVTGFVSAT